MNKFSAPSFTPATTLWPAGMNKRWRSKNAERAQTSAASTAQDSRVGQLASGSAHNRKDQCLRKERLNGCHRNPCTNKVIWVEPNAGKLPSWSFSISWLASTKSQNLSWLSSARNSLVRIKQHLYHWYLFRHNTLHYSVFWMSREARCEFHCGLIATWAFN